jgi:hypothetical protein
MHKDMNWLQRGYQEEEIDLQYDKEDLPSASRSWSLKEMGLKLAQEHVNYT